MSLLEQIEIKREEMIHHYEKSGMSSQQTIKCSQELDDLLNLYETTNHYSKAV